MKINCLGHEEWLEYAIFSCDMECNKTISKDHLKTNLDMLKVGLCGLTIAPFSLVDH
jgi:hypothetical protein